MENKDSFSAADLKYAFNPGLPLLVQQLEDEITERRRIECALRLSEQKYRELIQYANTILLRVDPHGIITFFNEFAQQFFEFTEEEILGKKVLGTIVPQVESGTFRDLDSLMDHIFHDPEKYAHNENENVKKSGERVWISWNNRPIFESNGSFLGVLCVGTDITARKKAEEALQDSERKYRFLFDNNPAGSIIIGTDGFLKEVNKTFLLELGYSRNDLIGKKALDFIIPEQQLIAEERIKAFFNGEIRPELDLNLIGKNGSIHTTRFSGATTLIYENEKPVGVLITGVDVTRRLHIEKLNLQQKEKLIQADKMATLGILVSGVAHEINNPNNFILLNSNNLLDLWKDIKIVLDKQVAKNDNVLLAGLPYTDIREDIEQLIRGITEGAERIRNIVENLKNFARKDSGNLESDVNINEVIDSSVVILSNLLKKSTDYFIVDCNQKLPHCKGNFQQIEQVIINLLTNACDALNDRKQSITLSTKLIESSIEIVITDQGRGISPEHINHIFDPFFTTKRDSGGTGLGLSISYTIIKEHRGELQISSTYGKGTTSRITLPVKETN